MGRRAIELPAAEAAEVPSELTEGQNESGPGLSLFDATGDARVRLLRLDDKTQKWIPHGYFPVDATEETVLQFYGGGRYWSQLLVQQENGREGIKQSRRFVLSGTYKPPLNGIPGIDFALGADGKPIRVERSDNGVAPAFTVAGVPTSGDDLMSVLKAGIINTLLEMMKSNKEMNNRQPQTDPMLLEMVRQQGAVQTKIIELMLAQSSKEPAGDSKKDMLDMMAKMKDLITPPVVNGVPTDPMAMFNSMLETFKSFRDAAEDVVPARSDNPVLDSIPKLVEVVAEQHQMQKEARSQAVMHVPTPAPHGETAQMPQVNTLPREDIPMWRRILREQSKRLLMSAAAQTDPDIVAGAAIVFAPPAVLESLKGFFHRDESEVIADIFTELPQLAEHRDWVADFVTAAQERLFPDEFTDEGEGSVEETAK